MDMAYAALAPGLHRLGVHRGVLFGALWDALRRSAIPVHQGTEVIGVDNGRVLTASGPQDPYEDVVMRRLHAGRLVFIGDAGHAMSPQLGQGVNLALLDAHLLTRCLATHADVDAALAAYSAQRRAHLPVYSWASRLMTPVFQSHLGVLGPPRDRLLHPIARIPWMRRQFLTSLTGAKTGVFGALDPDDYSA